MGLKNKSFSFPRKDHTISSVKGFDFDDSRCASLTQISKVVKQQQISVRQKIGIVLKAPRTPERPYNPLAVHVEHCKRAAMVQGQKQLSRFHIGMLGYDLRPGYIDAVCMEETAIRAATIGTKNLSVIRTCKGIEQKDLFEQAAVRRKYGYAVFQEWGTTSGGTSGNLRIVTRIVRA